MELVETNSLLLALEPGDILIFKDFGYRVENVDPREITFFCAWTRCEWQYGIPKPVKTKRWINQGDRGFIETKIVAESGHLLFGRIRNGIFERNDTFRASVREIMLLDAVANFFVAQERFEGRLNPMKPMGDWLHKLMGADLLGNALRNAVEFSRETFPECSLNAVVEHLHREVCELIQSPSDPGELADCAILVAVAADKAGVDLAAAVAEKTKVNKSRKWGEPDEKGVVEHVREEGDEIRGKRDDSPYGDDKADFGNETPVEVRVGIKETRIIGIPYEMDEAMVECLTGKLTLNEKQREAIGKYVTGELTIDELLNWCVGNLSTEERLGVVRVLKEWGLL